MLAWALWNSAVAALVALGVAACARLLRARPALAHALWLTALAALLMPPLPSTPGGALRAGMQRLVTERSATAEDAAEPAGELAALEPLRAADGDALAAPAGAASPAAPADRGVLARVSFDTVLALVWIAGALVVLARAALRVAPFARLVRRAPRAAPPLVREVARVARRLGVRVPETRVLAGIASPSVWCLGRPRLLWPAGLRARLAPGARAALIAHELAHLARRDHWVSWLEVPAAALLWWNPLFWWIRGRIRHFAELACDAWAVRAYPADRRSFAEALIDLQARSRSAPVALQGLGATDAECREFERRLDMIMQKRVCPRVSRGVAALAALAAVLSSPAFPGGDGEGAAAGVAVVEARATGLKCAVKARKLLAAGDHAGARAALEETLALDPANGWAHGQLGVVLMKLGESEAAKASFRQQFELGDFRPGALYDLARAHAVSGDRDGALEHLAGAVRHGFGDAARMENDPDLAAVRGDERFERQLDLVRAAAELKGALADPEVSGDGNARLATLVELAAIATADGMLQAEVGRLALRVGDRAAAVQAFSQQAEAGFDLAGAYYNRACARALLGERDAAVGDLFLAARKGMRYAGIATDPDLAALREMPDFKALQERIVASAQAQTALRERVLANDPAAAPALAELAAQESAPPRERAWAAQALGRLHLAAGRNAEALACFEEAAARGDVAACAVDIAAALAASGEREKARRHVEYALDLGFADPDALRGLLEAHSLAEPAEAEALVERAAKTAAAKAKAFGNDRAGSPAKPATTAKAAQGS